MKIQIVILNFAGAELLPQCLPSIVSASRRSHYQTSVTLLNNPGSKRDGIDYVRKHFPDAKIHQAAQNKVLCSYNEYLPLIKEPIVILLNNDIRVAEDFIDPLIKKFEEDPKTFLVAPRVMTFDGSRPEAGRSKAGVRFGLFWCSGRFAGYEKELNQASSTYSSGFGAFSREKFLELGGYDSRYLPGIMEDVDLCFRAQKAGYHLYYEPKSVVYHMGQASFKRKFGPRKTKILAHRNNFLFMWKSFKGWRFWVSHFFFLPLRVLFSLLKGDVALARGLVQAAQFQLRSSKNR